MPHDLCSSIAAAREQTSTQPETLDKPVTSSQQDAVQPSHEIELHPYTQTLTISNVDSCVEVENSAFPPHERATREKFIYRLSVCPELCLGIFTSTEDEQASTARPALPVNNTQSQRRAILLGHIVSTMSDQHTVTDNDMALPTPDDSNAQLGHKQHGRTVCLHSLAVLPGYQRQRLGSTLMRAYIHRLKSEGFADRLALIAHDYLVPYYERFGFESLGSSQAQFGGGGWYDMVLNLKES